MDTRRRPREQDPAAVAWRRACLLHAGFDVPLAAAVAADREVDVHGLIGLVERGCPPRLAVRILAPLDREGP